MSSFRYQRPDSMDEARARVSEPGAIPIGGGTDLIPLWRERRVGIDAVVDLRGVPDFLAIARQPDGGVRIGSAVTLTEIAGNPIIRESFPSLAQACNSVGSLQLRNMGTLGGNIGQRPRCWYFRHGHECLKAGGASCSAYAGENQYHAIFRTGRCAAAHPSDPAVALMALDASVETTGATARTLSVEELFDVPSEQAGGETSLGAGEVIRAIHLPAASAGGAQYFEKVIQRGAWDFALTSVAAVKRPVGDVRIVLGGVAGRPWRVTNSIEEDVASGGLSADDVETLAERAMYDAEPLAKNAYKVAQAKGLLRRAIQVIAS